MDFFILFVLLIFRTVIDVYIWIVVVSAIFSWLIIFNVFSSKHFFVKILTDLFSQLTDPALDRIRQFLPFVGGIDFSPAVLIIILYFIHGVVDRAALGLT